MPSDRVCVNSELLVCSVKTSMATQGCLVFFFFRDVADFYSSVTHLTLRFNQSRMQTKINRGELHYKSYFSVLLAF